VDGKDQRGRTGELIQKQHARAWCDHPPDTLDIVVVTGVRQGDVGPLVRCADLGAQPCPSARHCAVVVIGRHDLVARHKLQRVRNHVDGSGRVGKEDNVVRLSTDVLGDGTARSRQQLGCATLQQLNGVAFHVVLQALVDRLHYAWHGTEGAVVQEDEIRIE